METPQLTTETQPQVAKKRVIKIKKTAPKTEQKVEVNSVEEPKSEPVQQQEQTSDEKEQVSIIPSSRIKNYISKEKLKLCIACFFFQQFELQKTKHNI